LGHPVALTTQLGILLTGDDGNIYVACINNKAYAFEVLFNPGRLEEFMSCTTIDELHSTLYSGLGPYGLGYLPSRISHYPEPYHWVSPFDLLTRMCSASKHSAGIDPYPYLRTNTGLEPFHDLIHGLDHDAWNNTSIPLERIFLTSKTAPDWRSKLQPDVLEYKAREIKLRERITDRIFEG
jgi:hypothetical protein